MSVHFPFASIRVGSTEMVFVKVPSGRAVICSVGVVNDSTTTVSLVVAACCEASCSGVLAGSSAGVVTVGLVPFPWGLAVAEVVRGMLPTLNTAERDGSEQTCTTKRRTHGRPLEKDRGGWSSLAPITMIMGGA